MKRNEKDLKCKIVAQRGKKLLQGDTNKKRNTFVDIMIEKENEKIIIDTKYKKLESIDNVSNADIYQVTTYCLLHNAHHSILLYPQWSDEKIINKEYFLNIDHACESNRYKIDFKTINLKYEYIGNKESLCKIKKEIIQILNDN